MAHADDLKDRIQRAESWLRAADRLSASQVHESFVFQYIAVNALYGRRQYEGSRTEIRDDIDSFLERVKALSTSDAEKGDRVLLYALRKGRRVIEALLLDYFLMDDLFRSVNASTLRERAKRDAIKANMQLAAADYIPVLRLVLYRLTVLRNRVMHGCVTHGPKSKGLPSIIKGARALKIITPALLELIVEHGHRVRWDPIPYPRVGFEDPLERLEPD